MSYVFECWDWYIQFPVDPTFSPFFHRRHAAEHLLVVYIDILSLSSPSTLTRNWTFTTPHPKHIILNSEILSELESDLITLPAAGSNLWWIIKHAVDLIWSDDHNVLILNHKDKLQVMMTVAYEPLDSPVGRDQCAMTLEETFFKPIWKTLLRLFR